MDQIINEFVSGGQRNAWLEDGILSIYVRKSMRYVRGQYINTFDVANISTIPTQYQGQGHFGRFMKKVEMIGLPVFVESINRANTHLIGILQRNGYEFVDDQCEICCMIKSPDKPQ